jgi:hypothetical protein
MGTRGPRNPGVEQPGQARAPQTTPRKKRPAKSAGQAGQAASGFIRFVGEVRSGAGAGTLPNCGRTFPANNAGASLTRCYAIP